MEQAPFSSLEREPDLSPHVDLISAANALLHNSYPFAVHTPLMQAANNALDWKINHKGATTNA